MESKIYASCDEFAEDYVVRTQAELKAYAARLGHGTALLRDLKGWTSNYAPTIHCDVNSLLEAMPVQTKAQYIQAVSAHYNQRSVTGLLQDMVDAGVRLQSGLYGVDHPDTGTIRRGMAYMRNVFARDGVPDARLTALEHAVITQREPMQLRMPHAPVRRTLPRTKIERAVLWRADANPEGRNSERLSFADQLKASFGRGHEGR